MTDDPISRVTIIGTGQMGPTIAVATTLADCTAESKVSKQERRGVRLESHGTVICGLGGGWDSLGSALRR